MNKIAIYLAGTIKKQHEKVDESYWTNEDIENLANGLKEYAVSFLNPALRLDDLSDQYSVFGRDMLQVACSNVVCVDARDRRGLGVGAEMMWAKFNKIPVVTLAPKNSHYHKEKTSLLDVQVENWIHPFVESLSDKIVENIAEAAYWISQIVTNHSMQIKGVEFIKAAMQYYKDSQLQNDHPMLALITSNVELNERVFNVVPA